MAVNPLDIALTGLRAAQAQISVISNNVANASTDGYSRKTLQQYTQLLGDDPSGVRLGTVQRNVNDILVRDYRTQTSKTSALETRAQYLGQVQDFHGAPDAEQSMSSYIGKLKDAFSQLANQPESQFLISNVMSRAQQVVDKFSGFSDKITNLRNFAQTEMTESVNRINALTQQIADLNVAVKQSIIRQVSSAELEDQRDIAVKALASEVDLSFFKSSDGVLTVMTREGQLLADTQPVEVYFDKTAVGPSSYYPVSANAVRLGNPTTGIDLTGVDSLGGKLGELINLRDNTLPTYQAQADEMAYKMALRFSAEGLDMFTLPDGTIPANTPTSYAGFAADMTINPDIVSDSTLIRKGTSTGSTIQSGSSELLRKIIEFTFGDTAYQQSQGTVDISNAVPTLFTTLGITGQARIVGTTDVQSLGSLDSSTYINPGTEDTFSIQIGAGVPQNIAITAGMTASGLVTAINAAIPGTAQLGNGGELILTGTDTITIGAGTLGANGLAELGLTAGATAASAPYFTIAAGNNTPTTISILSTDTSTQLLSKLNAVTGISATLTVAGYLNVVPTEGGDITLVDGTGAPLAALGMVQTNIAHTAFNATGLGPAGTLDSGITGATNLQNYIAQVITLQSQDASETDALYSSEESYRAAIEKEYMDGTGVNIDEEMARLINIQTAYSASARTIQVAQQMLDELLATFSR